GQLLAGRGHIEDIAGSGLREFLKRPDRPPQATGHRGRQPLWPQIPDPHVEISPTGHTRTASSIVGSFSTNTAPPASMAAVPVSGASSGGAGISAGAAAAGAGCGSGGGGSAAGGCGTGGGGGGGGGAAAGGCMWGGMVI